MNVSILGNGAWGNAMYSVIQHTNPSVKLLGKGDSSSDNDIVILSVPTQVIRHALQQVKFRDKKIIINTAKGIETTTHLLPYEIVIETVGKDIEYYSLIGPSFANEVVQEMPTIVNLGYMGNYDSLEKVRDTLQTSYFRIKPTNGVAVLETSGALKNIYAIACGMAQGLGYGSNTRAKLIVLAIEEIHRLFEGLDLLLEPDVTAGTVGDLILTCNSQESRNFKFGTLLAHMTVDKSLKEVHSTVEGYHSLASVDYFEKKAGVALPLGRFIATSIEQNNPKKLRECFQDFASGVSQ